jgi:hypothetical protein
MNNIIYIGSTDNPNKFHVGMTSDNRSPFLRWQDADYRGKLPYVPGKVKFYSVGNLRDEPIHQYITKDSNVYSVKKEEGISSDEIFRVDDTNPTEYLINLVDEALNFNATGIRPVDKFFSARPHQAWVNQVILDRFDGDKTIVQPLNLCARFGKTLQALSLFKDSGLEVMVVAAHWLAANQSFIDTVDQKFDITSDVAVIKPDYDQFKSAIDKGQRVLIDVSLHKDAEKIDPRLISALSVYKKLIYIDEADYGAWTTSSRDTASKFINSGINLVCIATGTNIDRALIGESGHIEEPITVSYLDLIEAKRGEGRLFQPGGFCSDNPVEWQNKLSDIVDVAVLNMDVSEDLVDDLNELSDEKRPNMAKIFAKRNSHIQNKIIKSLLVDTDFGADVFGMYSTQYENIEHPAVMMFIPGKKSDVNNVVKVGKSIAPEYNWIALHGDEHTNRTAEKCVKDVIASGGEKTIIVSCSMGARSFSVPNIVAVINCKDGGSIGAAVQQASRCFTPGCGKTTGLIVNYSFNTDTTSSFESDLISSAIEYDPTDSEGAVRRVYGLMNFYKKDEEGYMVSLSETDFLEYVTSVDNLKNMGKATIDMKGLISNIDLLQILQDIQINSNTSKEWKGVIDKAVTYIKSDEVKEKGEPDEENKSIRDLIKKISSVVESTSNVYYMAPNQNTFKECLSEIALNPNKNAEYTRLVGVGSDIVYNEIYQFLNPSIMDLIIAKASKLDSMDNFASSSSKHSSDNLFDL